MNTLVDLSTPQRQSLWAPAFIALRMVRRIGYTQIAFVAVFAFTGGRVVWAMFGLVLGIAAVATASVLTWLRFTFHVENSSLVVNKGVLSVERLAIPFDRVQSVNINQQLLHRPIGLVEAQIDTAGSDNAELVINATSRVVAEQLRDLISNRSGRGPGSHSPDSANNAEGEVAVVPNAPTPIASRSVGDLIVISLTAHPASSLVVLAPLFAVGEPVASRLNLPGLSDVAGSGTMGSVAAFVIAGLVFALVALIAVRIGSVIVTDYGLRLSLAGDRLIREAGLLDRKSSTARVSKVQLFTTSQGRLQRLVNAWSVSLPTAGDSHLQLEGASADEVQTMRDLVLEPDVQCPAPTRSISHRATVYWARVPILVAVLVASIGAVVVNPFFALVLVVAPLSWLAARRSNAAWTWSVTDTGLCTQQGWWAVSTTEIALRRAQTVTVRQNLFERRHGLATLVRPSGDGYLDGVTKTPRPVVDAVVRSVTGRTVEHLVRLTAGGLNETYRAELVGALPVVVRIARRTEPWFTNEAVAIGHAHRAGVPVPEVLGVEHVDHDDELLSFSVLQLLPGRPLDELVGELPSADVDRLISDAGELLAIVRSLDSGLGVRHDLEAPNDAVAARAAYAALRTVGSDAATAVERGVEFVRDCVAESGSVPLALAHGDFLPKHLLIESGALVGVIDWEFAGPAPRAYDLAHWEVSAGGGLHDRIDALLRGYERWAGLDWAGLDWAGLDWADLGRAGPNSAGGGLVPAFAISIALDVLGWKNPASPERIRRCVDVIARHLSASTFTA